MHLQAHHRRRPPRLLAGAVGVLALVGLASATIVAGNPAADSPVAAGGPGTEPAGVARVEAADPSPPLALPAGSPDAMPGGPTTTSVDPEKRAWRAAWLTAQAPAVVRFRPRAGQSGISRLAAVSVRFTVAMDREATRPAFTASVDGSAVTGTYRWAEGDTVLVLTPARALPYGATVTLAVSTDARSADGVPLPAATSAVFRVAPRPPAATPAPTTTTPKAGTAWRWPLMGPITQYFGQSLTKYGTHYGIDIDGQTGDPIRAARSGRVVVAGHYDDCGGLEVHIDHGDGLVSWYRHLSRIDVRVGATVAAGTVIGRVGDTGCSLGSHLHFAIRRGSTFVDPLRYLPPR